MILLVIGSALRLMIIDNGYAIIDNQRIMKCVRACIWGRGCVSGMEVSSFCLLWSHRRSKCFPDKDISD